MSIDVLGALIVILILVVVAIPASKSILNSAKASNARSETASIGTAIGQYKYEIGEYPPTLHALTSAGSGEYQQYGPWLKAIKKDPWDNEYQYAFSNKGFVIYSYGSDEKGNGSSVENGIAQNDIGFCGK